MRKSFFSVMLIYLIFLPVLFLFIFNYPINNYQFHNYADYYLVPYSYDSLKWIQNSIHIKSQCQFFSINCFSNILPTVGYNEKTIALYGYFFIDDNLEFNQILYFSLNLIISFYTLAFIFREIQVHLNQSTRFIIYFIIILFLPYFFYTQLQLDKNFFSIIFLLSICIYFSTNKRKSFYLSLAIISGLLRNFTAAIMIYFLSSTLFKKKLNTYLFFLVLLIVLNYFTIETSQPALDNYVKQVNLIDSGSLNFFYKIHDLAIIPLFGLVGNLIRIVVNNSVGFLHIFNIDFSISTIYSLSYFSLSLSFYLFLYAIFNYNNNFFAKDPLFRIVILFMIMLSIVPFLQPRYYTPLIFPFIYLFINLRNMHLKNEK